MFVTSCCKDDTFFKKWFIIGSFCYIFWESVEYVGLLLIVRGLSFWRLMISEVYVGMVDEEAKL